MKRILSLLIKFLLIFTLTYFYSYKVFAVEEDSTLKQLQILQEDIKTLEKAVYSQSVQTTSSSGSLPSDKNNILKDNLLFQEHRGMFEVEN